MWLTVITIFSYLGRIIILKFSYFFRDDRKKKKNVIFKNFNLDKIFIYFFFFAALGVCANSGVPAQKGPLAQVSREFFFFFFSRASSLPPFRRCPVRAEGNLFLG